MKRVRVTSKEMELAKQISILIHDALDNVKKFYGVEDVEETNA